MEEARRPLPRLARREGAEATRLRGIALLALVLAAPAARGEAWIAARAELGRRAGPLFAAIPELGALFHRCGVTGASGIDVAIGDGKFVLHARGRAAPAPIGCLVGAQPDEEGRLAKDGPRIVAERGGLVLASPAGMPAVQGELLERLLAGKRADVAIAFSLEGADGLLTLDGKGGTLRVRLPAQTGIKPALAAIKNVWEDGVRVETQGTEVIVHAPSGPALINIVRAAFVDLVPVSGGSMRPTLGVGEIALILRKPIAGPARPGDVVFYDDPDAPVTQVKRVVALAGERVRVNGYRVVVNGEPILAAASNRDLVYEDGQGQTTGELWREKLGDLEWNTMRGDRPAVSADVDMVVPAGTLYVLGDSRDSSRDSRQTGPAPFQAVLGRASMIVWSPMTRWQRLGLAIR